MNSSQKIFAPACPCWQVLHTAVRKPLRAVQGEGPCALLLGVPCPWVMQSDTVSPRSPLPAVAGCTGDVPTPKHRVKGTPAFVISGFKAKAFFWEISKYKYFQLQEKKKKKKQPGLLACKNRDVYKQNCFLALFIGISPVL